MTTTGIQAPIVNFETTTTISTMKLVMAPTTLMAIPTFQRGSRRRQWCTTMPVCDRVKPVKTPTA